MNGGSEDHGTRNLDMETRLALVEQAIKHQAARIDGELIHVSERLKSIEEMLGESQKSLQESMARVAVVASENSLAIKILGENQKALQESAAKVTAVASESAIAIKEHEASDAQRWFAVAISACGALIVAIGVIVWSMISK